MSLELKIMAFNFVKFRHLLCTQFASTLQNLKKFIHTALMVNILHLKFASFQKRISL